MKTFMSIFLIAALWLPAPARAQQGQIPDAAELALALQKLSVLGSALFVGAHPDDENSSVLAYLSKGRNLRAAYLSVTRGEGGQNLIGAEKGPEIGLLRTQELLSARRVDGAEQFFTRAVDFGYTKTSEETFEFWGKEKILGDIVWVIRKFRPDVILTRFTAENSGGHGHHIATGLLVKEAFLAAADPKRFPEQLKYVQVWKAKRLLWNSFRAPQQGQGGGAAGARGGAGAASAAVTAAPLRLDTGGYSPWLGKSFTELAGESRSMHKSQGFGSGGRRGAQIENFDIMDGDPATSDIFDGVDLTWNRVPGGRAVGQLLAESLKSFDPGRPSKSIPALLAAYAEMNKLPADDERFLAPGLDPGNRSSGVPRGHAPVVAGRGSCPAREGGQGGRASRRPLEGSAERSPQSDWVRIKKEELLRIIQTCAGLWMEAIAGDYSGAPGDTIQVKMTFVNRSDQAFTLHSLALLDIAPESILDRPLKNNEPAAIDKTIQIPKDYPISQPYWLNGAPQDGFFFVRGANVTGQAENPPSIAVKIVLDAGGNLLEYTIPLSFRWTDQVNGELYRDFQVRPPVAIQIEDKVGIFPGEAPRKIKVRVKGNSQNIAGQVRLKGPDSWKITPAVIPFSLAAKYDEAEVVFDIAPPKNAALADVTAEAEVGGATWNRAQIEVVYPHIHRMVYFPEGRLRVVKLDVKTAGKKVGYVMGAGDEVPDALRNLGYDVAFLTDDMLESADLGQYDAIVTGVRAYNTRERLRLAKPRLLQYVERGGTLVVQYNVAANVLADRIGPYPLTIGRDRVNVETAPVTFLAPDHPLLIFPNKITARDFDGWVQERGLNFASQWDDKYETVLASHDPGEPDKKGGLLYARYGKGVFVFTALAWFRQLPEGVPGAYRIFANLVSAGKNPARQTGGKNEASQPIKK
jgi:LmbE family N-acetylglucosaminyl deacetylase